MGIQGTWNKVVIANLLTVFHVQAYGYYLEMERRLTITLEISKTVYLIESVI